MIRRLYFIFHPNVVVESPEVLNCIHARNTAVVVAVCQLRLLCKGAKPRFDTVLKVAKALGVRLTAQAVTD